MKRMLMIVTTMTSWCVLADTWVDMNTHIEWTYWVSPDNEIEVQEFSYYQEEGVATVNQYTSFGDLKIPSTIKGMPVRAISGFMFSNKNVDSVWMPDSILKIGDGAFYQTTTITNIHLSASLTTIGNEAFRDCQRANGLYLPSTVMELGIRVFEGTPITDVTIPAGISEIPEGTFSACCSLTNVLFHKGITSIGDRSFCGCTALKKIDLPSNITSIGREAFCMCAIKSLTIPNGIMAIGDGTFTSCMSLETISIPDSVITIGESAFMSCEKLKEVVLSDNVISIGRYAFSYCKALKSFRVPAKVTTLTDRMLGNCESLESVEIPQAVTSISDCFWYCKKLKKVDIPLGVIGSCSFQGCESLTEVILPEGITDYDFNYCTKLQYLTIPISVTSIPSFRFQWCNSIKMITFNGDAPATTDLSFFGTTIGCVAVPSESSGWDDDSDGKWCDIKISYYTEYNIEDAGEIKIHDDWIEKYVPGKSKEEVTELLIQPATNGKYKNWECYVLGLDPTNEESKIVMNAPQSKDSNKIDIGFNLNIQTGCGYKVNYSYVKDGEEISCGESGVSIDLTGDKDPSGLYTVKVKLIPDGSSTSTSEIEVEQTVGVRKSVSDLTKTAIAVPWGELTGKGMQSICVSNLVKTANLTVGDKLHVYNTANCAYETWQLSANMIWEPLATYIILADGSVSKTSAGTPTTTMIKRGSAVWLERQDTSKPFYLYGEYQSGLIETAISGGTTTSPVWNFVAPPTLEAYNLNNITGASLSDKIVVTMMDGPKVYTYEGGVWGTDVNTPEKRILPGGGTIEVVKKVRDTTNVTIPAGTGFMYVSQGGAPTINW